MNWVQKPRLYDQMVAWRAKHREATDNFQSTTNAAASTFAAAQTSFFSGMAELTTQAVIDRTQTKIEAKSKSLNASLNAGLKESLSSSGSTLNTFA